jgi:putative chitinase
MITPEIMRRFAPKCIDPAGWAQALTTAAAVGGIDTAREVQHWLAQLHVECAGFTDFEEDLWYRAATLVRTWPKRFPNLAAAQPFAGNPKALANQVYNGRMGNRPGTDDGWHFRGRGPKQITGRDNYTRLEAWMIGRGVPLSIRTTPELLLSPHAGAMSAAWFWKSNDLDGVLASHRNDGPAVIALTEEINGGRNGLAARQTALARIKAVWS